MTGDNINQVFRDQTGYQRYTGSCNTKQCVKKHCFPVSFCILSDPQRLCPHLLKRTLFQMFLNLLNIFFHHASISSFFSSIHFPITSTADGFFVQKSCVIHVCSAICSANSRFPVAICSVQAGEIIL